MTEKIETPQVYGDSTIAMSAHNLMAVTGGPMRVDVILAQLKETQHPSLRPQQLGRALDALSYRGLAKETTLGWMQTDPQRRLIISRNLDDTRMEDSGIIKGGWSGWMRREPRGGVSQVFSTEVIQ